MKEQIRFFLFCAAAMLLLPMAALLQPIGAAEEQPQDTGSAADAQAVSSAGQAAAFYRVLRTETGAVENVSVRDYLIGAVGAEMPASYETEALKAQAVAAHTYAERIRLQNAASPDAALNGADFSDDSRSYQAFYTEEQLRAFYGADFDTYYAKIAAAVDAVSDLLLYYEDEPIVAAFHAISAGKTEDAAAVWGTALPYLCSVDSEDDQSAPQYASERLLPPEAVRKTLLSIQPELTLPDDPAAWFTVLTVSDAGTVLTVQVGSEVWTGQALREALALRSACFTVAVREGQFVFETKGYGHDVGMSQYGANAMAQQGSSFAEILQHYYPETELR